MSIVRFWGILADLIGSKLLINSILSGLTLYLNLRIFLYAKLCPRVDFGRMWHGRGDHAFGVHGLIEASNFGSFACEARGFADG